MRKFSIKTIFTKKDFESLVNSSPIISSDFKKKLVNSYNRLSEEEIIDTINIFNEQENIFFQKINYVNLKKIYRDNDKENLREIENIEDLVNII